VKGKRRVATFIYTLTTSDGQNFSTPDILMYSITAYKIRSTTAHQG